MRRFLLNAAVLPGWGHYRLEGPIALAEARRFASGILFSAIGHAATANLLTRLLGREVPVARCRVILGPGDQALVFRLDRRLPESRVLDHNELAASRWSFGLLTRTA